MTKQWEPPKCDAQVRTAGLRMHYHRCHNHALKDGKCGVHGKEAQTRRSAHSETRQEARQAERLRRGSNERLGILARQIVYDVQHGRARREDVWALLLDAEKNA